MNRRALESPSCLFLVDETSHNRNWRRQRGGRRPICCRRIDWRRRQRPESMRQPRMCRRWRPSMIILRKPVAGLSDKTLARFLTRVCRAAKLKGTVNVLVTSNGELRTLNQRFLGKDAPTDVLSFAPMPGMMPELAGDIAISAEIAAHNARLLHHSPADEVKILALHGVLHLAGYDHEHDDGEMARKETSLRRKLNLPVGLTERNGSWPEAVSPGFRKRPRKKRNAAAATKLRPRRPKP